VAAVWFGRNNGCKKNVTRNFKNIFEAQPGSNEENSEIERVLLNKSYSIEFSADLSQWHSSVFHIRPECTLTAKMLITLQFLFIKQLHLKQNRHSCVISYVVVYHIYTAKARIWPEASLFGIYGGYNITGTEAFSSTSLFLFSLILPNLSSMLHNLSNW